MQSILIERTTEEMQLILKETFRKLQNLQLNSGEAIIKYKISFTPKDFREETKISPLTQITARTHTYTIDTTKKPEKRTKEYHKIEAILEGNQITFSAEGRYRTQLRKIINAFKPQIALLYLTDQDTQKLKKKANSREKIDDEITYERKEIFGELDLNPELDINPFPFEKRLIPQIFGGNNIYIFTKDIERYETRNLHKDILNTSPKQRTRIVKLTKKYNFLFQLYKNTRLKDFQNFIEGSSKINLGFLYDSPLITLEQAREEMAENLNKLKQIDIRENIILEDFEKIYEANQESLIKIYRDSLINPSPKTEIYTETKKDASRLKRLPKKAKLESIALQDKKGGILKISTKNISFGTIDKNSPIYSLQEYIASYVQKI